MVSSEKFEDFKDCEGAVSQNPLNLHSSEALKDKEDDLKDTVTEESHSNFKLSQLSKESEVLPPDMHVFDKSIRQEQVNYEPIVEDIHPEEQAEVSPVKLTVESNQRSDEIGASVNAMNTEMNESHVAHFSGEQKSDDVIKTSKEINFPEGNVMASTDKEPRDVSVGFATSQTSILGIDNISHHEKNRNEIDDVAVDGKCRGANEESNIGIRMETLQPSNLLQLEVKPSSDVFKSDDAGEKGKIEKCDITDTQCKEGPIVKDISLASSGSSHFESPIVAGDVMDGDARKSKGIDCTNIDALSSTREDIKEDEINNSSKVQEEVGAFSNLPQAQDAEILLKAVENYVRKHSSHSPLNTEHSAQYVSAVEDNQAVEPSGEPSGIIAVPVQDQSGNDLVKLGSSGIDASVNSSSRCDSLEGNWGSVSGFTFAEVNSVPASTRKVVCCHFSSDGKLLASGGHDKKAVLWYTDSLQQKTTLEGHSSLITDVCFSPSMPRLATSSFDKTVRVWDVDNPMDAIRVFVGHSAPVMSLDFHPNKEDLICSCDGDGEMRYWSINRGSCARVSRGGTAQMRFQPRLGRYLAAAAENVVSILDVETQACRYSLQGHTKAIHWVCWDPSGEFLASVSEDSVRVWTLGTGSEGECVHELSCNGNKFYSCVFHPTNSSLLVIGCYQSLELWNMTENMTMTLSAHDGIIAALAASTVTGLIASASHDKLVKLWK